MLRSLIVRLVLAFLAFSGVARAGEFQDDLRARRARVMERLSSGSALVLWSAPGRIYSRDVEYEFRQDSNLYYLTGIEQEDTILVLMPGNVSKKEFLFVKPRNPQREHWQGRLLSANEAAERSGVATVYTTTEFEPFVDSILSRRPYGAAPEGVTEEYAGFFRALDSSSAILWLVLEPKAGLSGQLAPTYEFSSRVRERFPGVSTRDAAGIFRDLRVVKTPYERRVLERSLEISSEAQIAGMRAARPGAYEYEVKAAIEYIYRARGALGWGYPSIVGSGPNATVLHYARSDRAMREGELLLVDAAACYEYLTGDITRSYPVGGRFSAEQKDIYRIVLAAQEASIAAARPGATLPDLHARTVEVIKDGLKKLGLITDTEGDQYRIWYTHGSSHFIGIDVHDVGDNRKPLEPGMSFTIEPGIYIQPTALDNLPRTKENEEFIRAVRPSFEKYRNIGVRIEDSFLMKESGLACLSERVPKTIEDIENFFRSRTQAAPAASPPGGR